MKLFFHLGDSMPTHNDLSYVFGNSPTNELCQFSHKNRSLWKEKKEKLFFYYADR